MNNLGTDSVPKLLLKLSTPAIVAQMVNILYNIVDRIFIGRMDGGEVAMAGLGTTLPIIIFITSCSALWGMGGAPLCAIRMGAGQMPQAERVLTSSFVMLLVSGVVLTIVFWLFGSDLLWFLGASSQTIGYGADYLSIYVIGSTAVMISVGMNPFINTQGFARDGMITILIGAVINIILDPIFIFTLNMGVKGAALATIIAQSCSAFWVIRFFVKGPSKLRFRKKYLKLRAQTLGRTLALGVAPFIMQSTESLVLFSLNAQLARFGGDISVGAMTIMTSIMQLVMLPLQGLGQGLQPIVSYNYGAEQLDRVRAAIKLAFKAGMGYNLLFITILVLSPALFASVFSDHQHLIDTTAQYIPIYFAGMSIFGAQMVAQQSFLALGQAKKSLFIAFFRKIVLLVPLCYIIPNFTNDKTLGVLLAEPISDAISAITATAIFVVFYRRKLC